MDISYSPEQIAFRHEVRAWLRANVPEQRLPSSDTPEGWDAHREWEQKLFEGGFAGIHWPREYGGRGAGVVMQAIFEEEYLLAGAPERISQIGQNLMGPTLMVHGTEMQKQQWLRGILSAEDIWSQGFSEPDAGSDLAGLRTRAVLDGDAWVINGQKIWTSYGANADWIFALVRTDPESPRHAGISFIAVDMKTEGIEARPIRQLDGRAGFAEVFFTDARVPLANVIGDVNAGWQVAMTTLGFERDAPSKPWARYRRDVAELARLARARGVENDPVVRDWIGALFADAEAYRHHATRTLSRLANGESLGPEASMTKVLWSEMERRTYEAGLDVMGPYGEVLSTESPADDPSLWHTLYWFSRAATIYAGTSEIQRNIIAERVLGLPKG
ncbi:MAG: acyl-CoA dehydrogenase family protein [Actinomycetota bacterium]|nr:acyl-CoA dehydrogenase family protein [Actinomycetota bacterium]